MAGRVGEVSMRDVLKSGAIVFLVVGLMAFFLRNADLASVWSEITRARFSMVVATCVAIVVTYLARIWRWQLLLAPIASVPFGSAARATVIGFATSSVLPGRLGEVLRPYLLARKTSITASAAFATVVLERLLDLITVVLLLGVFLTIFGDTVVNTDESMLAPLKLGGLAAAGGAVMALVVVMWMAGAPERTASLCTRVEQWLPGRLGRAAYQFLARFSAGFAVAGQPLRLGFGLLWSVPLWLAVAASAWTICQAFGIALPLSGALLVMVLMVLGVAVPTPAGVGGFHALFQIGTTSFYGAPVDAAVGAALVLHALSFGPITALGIVLMAREGLTWRAAVDLAGEDGQASSATEAAEPGSGAPMSAAIGTTGRGEA
ncbi:MAG: hypothetical protein CL483_10910 [Acidobacteria bacterium]|nr:hypothetical protein [Acidobacteriota bacterium]